MFGWITLVYTRMDARQTLQMSAHNLVFRRITHLPMAKYIVSKFDTFRTFVSSTWRSSPPRLLCSLLSKITAKGDVLGPLLYGPTTWMRHSSQFPSIYLCFWLWIKEKPYSVLLHRLDYRGRNMISQDGMPNSKLRFCWLQKYGLYTRYCCEDPPCRYAETQGMNFFEEGIFKQHFWMECVR